jgi:Tol biopolymer transport system component/serine/threonine protein kinase
MNAPGIDLRRTLSPGTALGRYHIDEVLGHGGMGVVYRAVDETLGRRVALKCIRPDHLEDDNFRHRLLRESRAASSLTHPSIVTVYEVLEADGVPVIVMELIDGMSLRRLIERDGPLPVDQILTHAEALADALAHAHERNVLHRDVNPSNILISRDGRAFLTDFGLARPIRSPEGGSELTTSSLLSAPGIVVGTPGYMSPDQLLGRHLDQRSDVFSLGAVLYEMCTGVRAFPTSAGDVIDATLNGEPVAIARLNYAIPEELERIVRKALAKRPDERYQHAAEMAADLRTLRRKLDSGATFVRARRSVRFRRSATIGAVALAVAAFAALALWKFDAGPWADQTPPPATPRQLTTASGLEAEPSISPDGSFIAYAASEASGDADLWLVDVVSGQTLRLTDDPKNDRSPAWFPDGSNLVFVSDRGGKDGLWKLPKLGGAPISLLPDATHPAVAPDGAQIAFCRPDENGALRIWVAPFSDLSRARPVSRASDGVWDHLRPSWSPDSTTLCYEAFDGLFSVPSAGGVARRLTLGRNQDRRCEWASDGRHVYYSALTEGSRALWRVSPSGGLPQRVTLGTGSEGEPSLSRDGHRLAYSTRNGNWRIMMLDARSGERSLLFDAPTAHAPVIAQDGSRVLFLSGGPHQTDLWQAPLANGRLGGPPARITEMPGGIGTFSVSPGGRWVAYHRNVDGRRDIWIGPANGGVAVNITDDAAVDLHPAWSPDGKSLAFATDREGYENIWVMPVTEGRASGPARRITDGSTMDAFPAWSPAGDAVAFLRRDGPSSDVWIAPVSGGRSTRVTTGAQAMRVEWSADPKTLLVSGVWDGAKVQLRTVNVASGRTSPFEPAPVFGGEDAFGHFSVSVDGSMLAYTEQPVSGDIWVLEASRRRF